MVELDFFKLFFSLCIGLVYPIFETLKVTQSDDIKEHQRWISYWMLYFLLYFFETIARPSYTSYFVEIKMLLLVIFIIFAEKLFFVFSNFFGNEEHIDEKLNELTRNIEKRISASTFFSRLKIHTKNYLLNTLKEDVPEERKE